MSRPRILFTYLARFIMSLPVPIIVLIVAPNIATAAATLDDLLQADKVRVKTWVEPDSNIIARQQVNLQIEIATDKWFSGGTRIGAFEISDAIVLQREKFAVNSTHYEDGETWTVQEWTIAVYPQRDGVFEIPDIPVKVSIASENLESIKGELVAPSLEFTTLLPESFLIDMPDEASWVATTRFEVKETYDKDFDDLKPGDAIVRSIRMSADDLPAMMLPDIRNETVDGIAIYPKPPQLQDKVNRGAYVAERVQTITYVIEKAGMYRLPRKTFYWWNLKSHSFESIELESRAFEVVDLTAGQVLEEQTSPSDIGDQDPIPLLMKLGISLLSLTLAGIIIRGLSRLPVKPQSGTTLSRTNLSETALRKQFEMACRQNNLELAIALFYQWLDNFGGNSFKGSVRERLNEINKAQLNAAFTNIMKTIFTPDQNVPVDLKLFAKQFIQELNESGHQSGFRKFRVELKLN